VKLLEGKHSSFTNFAEDLGFKGISFSLASDKKNYKSSGSFDSCLFSRCSKTCGCVCVFVAMLQMRMTALGFCVRIITTLLRSVISPATVVGLNTKRLYLILHLNECTVCGEVDVIQ